MTALEPPSLSSPAPYRQWMSLLTAVLTGAMLALSAAFAQGQAPNASPLSDTEKRAFFEAQVEPVFRASCYSCHSGPDAKGSLDLTSRAGLLKGGKSGPAVNLLKPSESLLLRAVHYDGREMPPQGKLPPAQIDALTRWVALGAPWSSKAAAAVPVRHGPPPVNAENKKFWSFQPVRRPVVPKVKNAAWVRNPIDAFVLARLEAKKFAPAPPASKTALLRRVYFDVTGLPPSPADIAAFLADTSPNAYEKVVDKLLASPQYGERWGRHWLDLVRYAETNSFERDGDKPFVWRYRDYVIRSFNADKPYSEFIREQIAGDELPNATTDSLIATGYYRLGQWDDEPSDPLQARYDELDDIVATTGQTFLGLTVNCARCHDHKIDPIPQKDYYSLVAFFQNVNRYGNRSGESVAQASLRSIAPLDAQKKHEDEAAAYKARQETLDQKIGAIEVLAQADFSPVDKEEFRSEQNRAGLLQKRVPRLISAEQMALYVTLTQERDRLRKAPPKSLEQALCVTETGRTAPKTFVLMRGNPHVEGDQVQPAFPSILSPPVAQVTALPAGVPSSGRRLALANWLASPANPLTARVMANRVFQFHFGRGIVRSSNNFGFMGDAPTHPELLDYLASELVRGGWHLKPLHRQILLSNTYRMSSLSNPKALASDPENHLLWRFDMRRLDAEEIRDSILAVNQTLNPKMGGPSVLVTIPKEVLAGQSVPGSGWGNSSPEEQARRSVYVKIKRSLAVPLFASFDGADTDAPCPVRFATTQPTQALGMMNSVFVNEQARLFARSLEAQAGAANTPGQVRIALRRTMQREPTEKEVLRGVHLIAVLRVKQPNLSANDALTYFCVVALNLNEFIYLD